MPWWFCGQNHTRAWMQGQDHIMNIVLSLTHLRSMVFLTFITHAPLQTTALGGRAVNCLDWTCAIHSLTYMSNLSISQPMEWLHCCLCYCSLWHHNLATIAAVTSQWDTHWGALSNQNAALLVLPSSNKPHDINWIKFDFLMDEIIISTH